MSTPLHKQKLMYVNAVGVGFGIASVAANGSELAIFGLALSSLGLLSCLMKAWPSRASYHEDLVGRIRDAAQGMHAELDRYELEVELRHCSTASVDLIGSGNTFRYLKLVIKPGYDVSQVTSEVSWILDGLGHYDADHAQLHGLLHRVAGLHDFHVVTPAQGPAIADAVSRTCSVAVSDDGVDLDSEDQLTQEIERAAAKAGIPGFGQESSMLQVRSHMTDYAWNRFKTQMMVQLIRGTANAHRTALVGNPGNPDAYMVSTTKVSESFVFDHESFGTAIRVGEKHER